MAVVDGVMMEVMRDTMKTVPGATTSIISLGNYYDCGIYLNWYQGRISMNIWSNGTIDVNYFDLKDKQIGWDFQSHETKIAISIVKGLVEGIKNEVICE